MSANGTNRYTRTNPNINRNPLWNFTLAHTFQGTVAGYATAGIPQIGIDKFPFATDANATDVGNLSVSRRSTNAGQSSAYDGYTSAGFGPTWSNVIDKFSFASNANATDVGDVTFGRYSATGQSSDVSGYTSGGHTDSGVVPYGTSRDNIIDKFPFATNANATNVGDLSGTGGPATPAGHSSTVSGYTAGAGNNVIEKFPFATDSNATDVGDLTVSRSSAVGQSSTVSGYTSGGGPVSNVIDKFPFASDANATDVGDLTVTRSDGASQSSTVSGYTSGGYAPSVPGATNVIDKFPFASNANATDVGDLVLASYSLVGQQD
jgi:hypothetical protein